ARHALFPLARLVLRFMWCPGASYRPGWCPCPRTIIIGDRSRATTSGRPLLERDLGAAVFQLLLDLLGLLLGHVLLDRLGRPFDQFLGLLQAQAGDLADHLDDVDLLGGVEAVERDRELGLLGRLLGGRGAGARRRA